jgi:L1 cell adhesion molecule like protein
MYLSIGVSGHGRAEIIPNGQGNRMTPSCDALTYTDHLIGDADKNLSLFNPINTIFSEYSRKRRINLALCFVQRI